MWKLDAQPSLTFKRVTVNWPTIELYFDMNCDGEPRYDATKQNLRIYENGEEIRDFTLWCPDPSFLRCVASLGMVVDVSGSMRGLAMAAAKQSAHDMVYFCDGVLDELMLLQAGAKPLVTVPFTPNKVRLHSSIDSCSPGGATALIDGVYAALEEVIANGVHMCRALIVFSDGGDNGSSHTAEDVILLANRNRIRVFTMGYDDYGPMAELEIIAQRTGGRFFQNPSTGQLAMIYQEITMNMFGVLDECIVTYERECADGTQRNVELQLVDFCGGSDAKTKTYRAPLDSSSFRPISVEIPKTLLIGLQQGTVPVMVDGPESLLQPFELTLRLDPAVTLTGIDAPPGSLLHGMAYQIDQRPGQMMIRTTQPLQIHGRAKLLDIVFRAPAAVDTIIANIAIDSMIVPTGCMRPVITNNQVLIVRRILPFIIAPNTGFCVGDSVTLEANAGFTSYRWSTGETTRSIRIGDGGMYGLSVVDADGDTLHAAQIAVTRHDLPRVSIATDGLVNFCRGKSVRLFCIGDTAGARIRWSNGHTGSSVTVSNPGSYWADVTSATGCTARSDTIQTTMTDIPVQVLPGYGLNLCPGDTAVLSVAGKWSNVRWWGENRETLTVPWKLYGSFSLQAEVTDSSGCKGLSDTVRVNMRPGIFPGVTPAGVVELCQGGTVTLTADSGYAAYNWSNGDSTRSIVVDSAGTYAVHVTNQYGCSAWTEVVQVVMVSTPKPRISTLKAPIYCGTDGVILDGGANYLGWKWSNGATTRTISVTDSGAYWVEVTAFGGCTGISDTIVVRSEQLPGVFLPTVRGSLPLCPGDTVWLDAPEGMAHWLWNTGLRARSLPVTQAGRYAVTVLTSGGCEAHSGIIDLTMTQSARPVITRSKDVLTTSTAQSYQWYFNGQPIAGATQQTLTVVEKGSYTVVVVDEYGCTMTSEPFVVNILGISGAEIPDDLLLYPEPASDWLQIAFPEHSRNARVTLVSLLGQVLAEQEASGDSAARSMRIDLTALPAGVYLLHASAGEKWWVRKVVVRR